MHISRRTLISSLAWCVLAIPSNMTAARENDNHHLYDSPIRLSLESSSPGFHKKVKPAIASELTKLFDGKTLDGWEVRPTGDDNSSWKIENRTVVAENPDRKGSVLWTTSEYQDYELELEYRASSDYYDSGVFVRGPSHQVQIGISGSLRTDMTACIYAPIDKQGKYPATSDRIAEVHKVGKWNHLRIVLTGKRLQTYLNQVPMVSYEAKSIPSKGPIRLQLHAGHPMRLEFRNIRIRDLESP